MELNHQEKPETQRKPFPLRKPQENTKKNHEITKKTTLFIKKTHEKTHKKTNKILPPKKTLSHLVESRQLAPSMEFGPERIKLRNPGVWGGLEDMNAAASSFAFQPKYAFGRGK